MRRRHGCRRLSSRDFAVNVWTYGTTTRRLEQLTHFKEFDARNLEAGGGVLVFEQVSLGEISLCANGRQPAWYGTHVLAEPA